MHINYGNNNKSGMCKKNRLKWIMYVDSIRLVGFIWKFYIVLYVWHRVYWNSNSIRIISRKLKRIEYNWNLIIFSLHQFPIRTKLSSTKSFEESQNLYYSFDVYKMHDEFNRFKYSQEGLGIFEWDLNHKFWPTIFFIFITFSVVREMT